MNNVVMDKKHQLNMINSMYYIKILILTLTGTYRYLTTFV